jgi:hypothetical protein
MADIRVERGGGGHLWLWIALAVILIIAAVVLLDYFGYITLPVRFGSLSAGPAFLAQLGPSSGAPLLEV